MNKVMIDMGKSTADVYYSANRVQNGDVTVYVNSGSRPQDIVFANNVIKTLSEDGKYTHNTKKSGNITQHTFVLKNRTDSN